MLDHPEKTPRLLAALKAAAPFEVELAPSLIDHRQAENVANADRSQVVWDLSYAGDEGVHSIRHNEPKRLVLRLWRLTHVSFRGAAKRRCSYCVRNSVILRRSPSWASLEGCGPDRAVALRIKIDAQHVHPFNRHHVPYVSLRRNRKSTRCVSDLCLGASLDAACTGGRRLPETSSEEAKETRREVDRTSRLVPPITPAEILAPGRTCVSPEAAAQRRIVSGGEPWPSRRELSRHLTVQSLRCCF
jgi:hypothetical protein